ncbi:MAG: bifunctional demethylmenaquinone methyltransferase/2-methoxy-6-polyprenyl-1,4-benzoquinol methylase UbiE [Deltaproteobacteria bacterium]|nr:bifunctional demethylmenaquinone methyltransferase/2-methoxy-6-polyprenyl-1,4-benzoquinol methylase UbiE [Deltaproteobacteria bacterium]
MPETKSIFNTVAKRYDILNTIFSLGIDRLWRKRLVEELGNANLTLDIATGTAGVAIEALNKLNSQLVIGIDLSGEMLELAQKKLESLEANGKVILVQGAAENLPFKKNTFDAVTIAFGIRNTVDPVKSLREMNRVLRSGGKLGVLEFSVPQNKVFGPFYMSYLRSLLPFVGSIFGTRKEYEYLADSIPKFPQRESFIMLMKEASFGVEKAIELTFGTVIIYIGVKEN